MSGFSMFGLFITTTSLLAPLLIFSPFDTTTASVISTTAVPGSMAASPDYVSASPDSMKSNTASMIMDLEDPAPVNLAGYYELDSNPQDPAYNEYLTALGVSEPFRQVLTRIKMSIQIDKSDDGAFSYKVITPLMTHTTAFKFDEEIEDVFIDKRKFKTTFTLVAPDTVKQVLKFDNVTASSVYTFTPGGLTAAETAKDKTVLRVYKRKNN